MKSLRRRSKPRVTARKARFEMLENRRLLTTAGPEIDWSTFLGGSAMEWGQAIVSGGDGSAYAVGMTTSSDLYGASGLPYAGGHDMYVARIGDAGEVLWITYFGGSGNEITGGIALDPSGNILISGTTSSSDLPLKTNDYHGGEDAFVAKLASDGTPMWSTYLGGSAYEFSNFLGVDDDGNALVPVSTESPDFEGATNTWKGGSRDACVVKVSSDGDQQWAVFVGGAGLDEIQGIAVDDAGTAYVAGSTDSTDLSLANNTYHGGSRDAFVAAVTGSGAQVWATYLGGDGWDHGVNAAVDTAGNVFVCGSTDSNSFAGAVNSQHGAKDGFVAQISAESVQWMTYVGGADDDGFASLSIDHAGRPTAAGYTRSPDVERAVNSLSGPQDGLVAGLADDGSVMWSMYLGGGATDEATGVVVGGDVFISGTTSSTDLPGRTNSSLGSQDGFVSKIIVPAVDLHDGVLTVIGTNQDDHVAIIGLWRGRLLVYASFLEGQRTQYFAKGDIEQINVRLHDGNDSLTVAGRMDIPIHANGGSGNDLLRGGSGNDILVGGEGQDFLHGRRGDDLLIGGSDRDVLFGGYGEDLLISGTTAFDLNSEALHSIMDEWTSGRDYAVRAKNIRGENNAAFGDRLNRDFFLKVDGEDSTVFDDDARDVMSGGVGRDWYFANYERDDGGKRDFISGRRRHEFVDDLDTVLP